MKTEGRFSMLWQTHPDDAKQYLEQAQHEVNHRYHYLKQLAEISWADEPVAGGALDSAPGDGSD
jgi:pyruvate-ferredoxin/flavodoxin oxidoreductase